MRGRSISSYRTRGPYRGDGFDVGGMGETFQRLYSVFADAEQAKSQVALNKERAEVQRATAEKLKAGIRLTEAQIKAADSETKANMVKSISGAVTGIGEMKTKRFQTRLTSMNQTLRSLVDAFQASTQAYNQEGKRFFEKSYQPGVLVEQGNQLYDQELKESLAALGPAKTNQKIIESMVRDPSKVITPIVATNEKGEEVTMGIEINHDADIDFVDPSMGKAIDFLKDRTDIDSKPMLLENWMNNISNIMIDRYGERGIDPNFRLDPEAKRRMVISGFIRTIGKDGLIELSAAIESGGNESQPSGRRLQGVAFDVNTGVPRGLRKYLETKGVEGNEMYIAEKFGDTIEKVLPDNMETFFKNVQEGTYKRHWQSAITRESKIQKAAYLKGVRVMGMSAHSLIGEGVTSTDVDDFAVVNFAKYYADRGVKATIQEKGKRGEIYQRPISGIPAKAVKGEGYDLTSAPMEVKTKIRTALIVMVDHGIISEEDAIDALKFDEPGSIKEGTMKLAKLLSHDNVRTLRKNMVKDSLEEGADYTKEELLLLDKIKAMGGKISNVYKEMEKELSLGSLRNDTARVLSAAGLSQKAVNRLLTEFKKGAESLDKENKVFEPAVRSFLRKKNFKAYLNRKMDDVRIEAMRAGNLMIGAERDDYPQGSSFDAEVGRRPLLPHLEGDPTSRGINIQRGLMTMFGK